MKMADLVRVMESIAPRRFAAEWDNVGLLLGTREDDARRVLLTIDLTDAVLNEAIAQKATAIIAYHPPIFVPLKSLADGSARERLLLRAARAGLAVYSPHTALDAAPDGLTDWLARAFGSGDIRALHAHAELPDNEATKVITFCPKDDVDRLRNALASIGAGRIGAYEQCSFELAGTGTFFATDEASPAVGGKGHLERVAEVRLEMVCPQRSLALAMTAIRQFHPYEEPPIEIHALSPRPDRSTGEGRRIVLDRAVTMKTLASRMKEALGVPRVKVAAAPGMEKIQTIGVCAGSGVSLLDEAIADGCELFFTGEMRHHEVLSATARGCAIMLAGHTNTERGYLPILRDRLAEHLPKAEFIVSKADRDPFEAM